MEHEAEKTAMEKLADEFEASPPYRPVEFDGREKETLACYFRGQLERRIGLAKLEIREIDVGAVTLAEVSRLTTQLATIVYELSGREVTAVTIHFLTDIFSEPVEYSSKVM